MGDFTDKIALVLEKEFNNQNGFVGDWIKYPHSHSMDARNSLQLEQLQHPVYYPDRAHISPNVQK